METNNLKKFAQYARRYLLKAVADKLRFILEEDSSARRENPVAVSKLEALIRKTSKEQVIRKVAYTWFNRFCALRYMDVNHFNRVGIVSPMEGQFQPEILAEAKLGHIDELIVPEKIRTKIFGLLNGSLPSNDPQAEAYQLLITAACNYYYKIMPFLFEEIADYTELLMPDDLLSGNSILANTRETLTPDVCKDVEVIGWLYQFYISEKKDEVFEGLKKNKKITPENIPAATQLFTPHWIVRYMVENSLGRLWMLNNPNSQLVRKMDYYIQPEEPEKDFLKITSPEELKICDPACGSGHILTYAFDLLYEIYKESGYPEPEIPTKIILNNLYGIEIDERAGELASFALVMKCAGKQKRFLRKPVQPNICILKNIEFTDEEMSSYMNEVGEDLFTIDLRKTLLQFAEADNFGSLIVPSLKNPTEVFKTLKDRVPEEDLFFNSIHKKVLDVINQVDYLTQKYHCVIANPPYLGRKGMNNNLKEFSQIFYPNSWHDLFAMFIERNLNLALASGYISMITRQSWMFIPSFTSFRKQLFDNETLLTMAHFGARAFDSISGEVVSTTSFTIKSSHDNKYKCMYFRLVDGGCEDEKQAFFKENIANRIFYSVSVKDLKNVDGMPVAYWIGEKYLDLISKLAPLGKYAEPRPGLQTSDNERFLRLWHEIVFKKIGIEKTNASNIKYKWFPHNKGGKNPKKWYGNIEFVINFYNDGEELKHWLVNNPKDPTTKHWSRNLRNYQYYFLPGVTWSAMSSDKVMGRRNGSGFLFDTSGPMLFCESLPFINLFVNCKVCQKFLRYFSQDLSVGADAFKKVPLINQDKVNKNYIQLEMSLVEHAKTDWDNFETSWDFIQLPLLCEKIKDNSEKLENVWDNYWNYYQNMTSEMKVLEEENNRIFIEAYGLKEELDETVPLNEITLTGNPQYRYGAGKTLEEYKKLMLADTMKEFISYAVGCMFGRYSLDKTGLILANQGETLEDYLKQLPEPSFMPDKDNVIPVLDDEWFNDDIAERFKEFLKVTFGNDNYSQNLEFLESAIGCDIRKYFVKDFYNDHIKRYKKRPIYWQFCSPSGSFNVLTYMHRYQPDTVNIILNDYLREYRNKLQNRKDHLEGLSISSDASKNEKTKALKEIDKIKNIIVELEEYERTIIYPIANERIKIDLDDGVKVNYPKFGKALKNVKGLS